MKRDVSFVCQKKGTVTGVGNQAHHGMLAECFIIHEGVAFTTVMSREIIGRMVN